jgi:hypothetical protein
MGLSVFNTALNTISKVSSFTGTGSQVIRGLKNPNPAQGISGVLTALSGRSSAARKLLTIDSKFKDILTKVGGINDLLSNDPKPPTKVWSEDPNSIVNQATSRPDPQMNFCWEARLVSLNEADELIAPIYIEEISVPGITLEQHTVFREGVERSYIAGVSINSCNIKLYEDVTGTAAKFMLSWANAGYSNTFGTFTGSFEYKKQIVISLLDPYGTVSARFVLGGCFPTSLIDGYDFTSGAATPISPTAVISVDTLECISINDDLISSRSSALASMASDPRVGTPSSSLESMLGQNLNQLRNSSFAKAEEAYASIRGRAESAASSALGKIQSFF